MKKPMFQLASHLQAFVLGLYFASQFRFGHPIEPHKWVISSFLLVGFLISYNNGKSNR